MFSYKTPQVATSAYHEVLMFELFLLIAEAFLNQMLVLKKKTIFVQTKYLKINYEMKVNCLTTGFKMKHYLE